MRLRSFGSRSRAPAGSRARWCPAVLKRGPEERADWEILLEIAERLGGGASGISLIDKTIRLARKLGLRWTPKASLDVLLRLGPYGDRYLPWSKGLSLKRLAAFAHGLDLGPLEPGVSRRVLHRDRRIRLAAEPIVSALAEMQTNGMAGNDTAGSDTPGSEPRSGSDGMIPILPRMVAG